MANRPSHTSYTTESFTPDDSYDSYETSSLLSQNTFTPRKKHKRKQQSTCCSRLLRPFKAFFLSPPDQYTGLKTVLGFPFGALIGIGLYYLIIEPIQLPLSTRELVGGIMTFGLACGYSLSSQVRCITWLLLPTFFGKKGRSYIGTFAIAFLISGPIHNIILNGKEITRSLTCAVELSANHTSARWKLTMKPLADVMEQFKNEGLYLSKVSKKLNETFAPIRKELRDKKEEIKMKFNVNVVDRLSKFKRGKRIYEKGKRVYNKVKGALAVLRERAEKAEEEYKQKLTLRCEDVYDRGVLKCRQKFQNLERDCLNTIPVIGYILCLPLKLTFFCQIMRVIPKVIGMSCDAMNVVERGFGETYTSAEDAVDEMEKGFEVNLQYKMVKSPEDIDYSTAEEIKKKTMYEFEKRETWVDFFMIFLKRFLAFTFILVFISAYQYNKKYLSDFRFDNVYITQYYRHIDARRKARGKSTLLPLKKFEAGEMIFPSSKKLLKAEKAKIGKGTFMIIMRCLVSGIIIWSANLLYDVMDIIQRNSRIDFTHEGEHHIKIDINGDGFMSTIVRLFFSTFDKKEAVEQVTTNFECLPRPVDLKTKEILYIYGVYLTVWTLMLMEAYGLRLRRLVASFFYRKREKRRVLYLYNDMLKKRKGFLLHMRHRVLKQARKLQLTKTSSLLHSLVQQFPKLSFLKRLKSSKGSCLICDDTENEDFVKCQTPGCNFGYCAECWIDIRRRCYACMPYADDNVTDTDLTDDDLDDDID